MRLAATILTFLAAPAAADLRVDFIEGAPKDRFVLTNEAGCGTGPMQVEIQLAGSAGALIFDTTGTGAGVQVFQPFEVVSGAALLKEQPDVTDGDQSITLDLIGLAPGAEVAFTIDVDDTVSARQITVAGSEIAGASVRVGETSGVFDENAVARVPGVDCLS